MLQSDKMVGKRRGTHVRSPSLLENTVVSLATYMWIHKSYSADIRGLGTSQKGIPNFYRSKTEHLQCHSAAAGLVVNQLVKGKIPAKRRKVHSGCGTHTL